MAGEEEAEVVGRLAATRRDPLPTCPGLETKATYFLTSYQEPLHPEENMYSERENGGNMLRVANLSDTTSSLPAGLPK